MKLDVGCGLKPHGHVNVDIYRRKNPEINSSKIIDVDVHKIPNFVSASGEKLPFQNESFNEVYCFHVIEHVKNPYRLLKELMRVCKRNGTVYLSLPHRFSYGAKYKGHIHFFTRRWFEQNLKYPFKCSMSYWSPFKFFLFFPNEIQLQIFKKEKML